MIYWTTYNFAGYLLYKNNYIPMNSVLRTSFICTSIIGGYMVYVYPRKLIIEYQDKKYNVPYPLMILGDIITHQIPLIDTFNIANQIKLCGGYLAPLMISWYSVNKYRIEDSKRIYGISLEKLLLTTSSIIISLGIFNHLPKLLKKD
tara:strand:+ start:15343 stop:15783 length:441 start_codon:yes stop_codon:yes gene_type:complete